MADDNNQTDVLNAQHNPLARENAELRARLAALEKQNVVEGRFTGEMPRYHLNEPIYVDDTLFPAGSVIEYTDVPNMAMVPLNDPARHRMEDLIDTLENGARRVAAKNNRDFIGLVTDRNVLIDTARLDAKTAADAPAPAIKMPEPYGQVPAMPHTDDARAAERRRPGRPKKAVAVAPSAPARDAGAPMLMPVPSDSSPGVVGRMVSG